MLENVRYGSNFKFLIKFRRNISTLLIVGHYIMPISCYRITLATMIHLHLAMYSKASNPFAQSFSVENEVQFL